MAVQYVGESIEYIRVRVTVTKNGVAFNPTSDVVKLAFTENDSLEGTETWHTGSWETAGGVYYARCLVGPSPGNTILTPGVWYVWVKVTDSPEVPIKSGGPVKVI
jgi:hypothetical protein